MKQIFIFMISFFLLSCGGGSSTPSSTMPEYEKSESENNTTEDVNNTVTRTLQGRAVDGEIANATIFLDLNLNGKYDSDEPKTTTQLDGSYILELNAQILAHANYIDKKATLIMSGGFDMRSKAIFEQTLKASLEENSTIHITPISTLIAALVELNTSLEDAKDEIASTLVLSRELLSKDPIKALEEGDERLYNASLKLHSVAKVIRYNAQDTNASYYQMAVAFKERQNSSDDPIKALIKSTQLQTTCQNDLIRSSIIEKATQIIDESLAKIDYKEFNATLVTQSIDIETIMEQLQFELQKCQNTTFEFSLESNQTLEYKIVYKILTQLGYKNEQTIMEISKLSGIDAYTTPHILLEMLQAYQEYSDVVQLLQSIDNQELTDTNTHYATNSDLIVKRTQTSQWNSGYCENIEIFNSSSEAKIWNIDIAVTGSIYTLWNAHYQHDISTQMLHVYGVDFNRAISPKSSVSFGYCANTTTNEGSSNIDTNTTSYTSQGIQVQENIRDDWGSGYCSDITIINQSGDDLLWETSFQAKGKITDLWNAKFSQDPQTLVVTIKGVDYNSVVRAYGSVSLGYCASKDGEITEETTTTPTVDTTLSDEESVAKDYESLTFDSIKGLNLQPDAITSNLFLMKLGKEGSHIVWSSNDSSLSNEGVIKRSANGSGDTIVELNATISKGTYSKSKTFDLLIKELPATTSPTTQNYIHALDLSMTFYEAQKASGPFNRVTWRKSITKGDGNDVDVNLDGGWFDAGDHVKFNLPMSYSVTMLIWSMIDNPNSYKDLTYAKEQVKYALDYLSRSYSYGKSGTYSDDRVYYQVGDGDADHSFWGPPQDLTMERPTSVCSGDDGGCAAVSGSMAAAFAAGYILLKDQNTTCANDLLTKAQEIYAFAKAYPSDNDYRDAAPFYQLFDDNKDQLAWGAIWLYIATKEEGYLIDAKTFIANKSPVGWVHSWDNVTQGVVLLLAQTTNEASYHTAIAQSIDHWINNVPKSPAGLRVISEWGSLRYASTEAFISAKYASIVSDTAKRSSYLSFAKSQIDYILGDNPINFSYQISFGENYPLNPHHRAAHDSSTHTISSPTFNTHTLVGALVGGPLSANDYDYKDDRNDYKRNEVATDYNAGFSAALAQLIALEQ